MQHQGEGAGGGAARGPVGAREGHVAAEACGAVPLARPQVQGAGGGAQPRGLAHTAQHRVQLCGRPGAGVSAGGSLGPGVGPGDQGSGPPGPTWGLGSAQGLRGHPRGQGAAHRGQHEVREQALGSGGSSGAQCRGSGVAQGSGAALKVHMGVRGQSRAQGQPPPYAAQLHVPSLRSGGVSRGSPSLDQVRVGSGCPLRLMQVATWGHRPVSPQTPLLPPPLPPPTPHL